MPGQSASVEETGKVPRRDWVALPDWIVKACLADLLAVGQSHVDVFKRARETDDYPRGQFGPATLAPIGFVAQIGV
ncbi:hypothetical protein ACP2AV_06290 [Aliiroseovarius sp. PTFE2010]|uniref:hypothetical protein n=1 Tax=Aliiroseovarius sp. PTFE2010 TaxID=3417190 RepID=UPI003CE7A3DF